MTNWARFTINGTASTTGGYDALAGDALSFALEASPGLVVRKTEYWVYSAADPDSPLASKSAPELSLVGATTGQRVQAATPAAVVNTTLPALGVHSWIVRCQVNDGVDEDGSVNPDYVFERMICVRSASGRRKIVPTEGTMYSPRGWADAQNDDVDGIVIPGGMSNVLYVDVNGDDLTAVRGNSGYPYATIQAALNDAASGDCVQVGPGTFAAAVLLPELAAISIIGAGVDQTFITSASAAATLAGHFAATKCQFCELRGFTVINTGAGHALDIVGLLLAVPGVFIAGELLISEVCSTGGAGTRLQCAGRVVVQHSFVDAVELQEI
ncbi:MAG: hypothetical protein ACYC6C_13600, partial [Coriobacteriia bacterium]